MIERPKSAAAAVSSACGHGNAVGLTSIFDREQFSQSQTVGGNHSPTFSTVRLLSADARYFLLSSVCGSRKDFPSDELRYHADTISVGPVPLQTSVASSPGFLSRAPTGVTVAETKNNR